MNDIKKLNSIFTLICSNDEKPLSRSLELKIDNELITKKNSEFEFVSFENKIDFVSRYIDSLNNQKIPVIVNSSIPKTVKKSLFDKLINKHIKTSAVGHVLCSSGTTSKNGIPKSYFFSLSQSIANAKAHYDSLNITKKYNILFPLPVTHSFGVVVGVLGSFSICANTYLYEVTPSPTQIAKDIDKYNIDLLYLTPTIARMIIKFKKFIKLKGTGPRKISIGSSPFYKNEVSELMEIFKNAEIYFTYGLTEAGPRVTTLNCGKYSKPNPILLKSNTLPLGKPLRGVELNIKETLFIKSKYAHCNEFFNSEDMIKNECGINYLKGRSDFVIISGGVNIYPNEIEAIVDTIDGIKRSCLIGLKSQLYGEVPVLAFSKNNNTELTSRELSECINAVLIKYLPTSHIPHDIIELNNIETTSLDKVMRVKVANMIKDKNDKQTI